MKNISKKALAFAILCSFGVHTSFAQCNATLFAGGTGTEADPYQISTPEQLQNLNKCLRIGRNNYVLNNDIDLTLYLQGEGNNGGAGWKPIGTFHNGFYGKLNGNGHKVSGLWINRPTEGVVGLFGKVSKEVSDINVEIDYFLGGGVRGSSTVGGLVGYNDGIISNSYVTGNVSGEYSIGGLVGESSGTISNSYATGNVWGSELVGGLVGINFNKIDVSYATGKVIGNLKNVGGLVGYNNVDGSINESYATGSVLGGHCGCGVGGLVGNNRGEINNSYYNKQTVAMTDTDKETGKILLKEIPQTSPYIGSAIEDAPIVAFNRSTLVGNILVHTTTNTIQLSNLPPNANVEIYNIQGKRIYSAHSGNPDILRIGVQTGMYIIKINSQTISAIVR
ncbi:MAG: T9SS type A sorting domain-containing protein [Fibromonadales bacterium]|nr:T9SS type A sorting domain-containing protein [Fibromonadales bacterium]